MSITGAITPGYAALEYIAQMIDRFPHLTQRGRAELFSAIDLAPEFRPEERDGYTDDEIDAWYEQYQKGGAQMAWGYVRTLRVKPSLLLGDLPRHDCPTKGEILKALDRAARITKGKNA